MVIIVEWRDDYQFIGKWITQGCEIIRPMRSAWATREMLEHSREERDEGKENPRKAVGEFPDSVCNHMFTCFH